MNRDQYSDTIVELVKQLFYSMSLSFDINMRFYFPLVIKSEAEQKNAFAIDPGFVKSPFSSEM